MGRKKQCGNNYCPLAGVGLTAEKSSHMPCRVEKKETLGAQTGIKNAGKAGV